MEEEITTLFAVMQKLMALLNTAAKENGCSTILVTAVYCLFTTTGRTSSVGHAAEFVPPRHG
jgi:hypothetical protein